MENKSENYFKEYLKNVTNEQLIQFYDDIEWTLFPVLVIKEYQQRFNIKNKKEIIEKLKIHAELAKEKSRKLSSIAKNRSSKVSKKILSKGQKLSKSVENTKHLVYSEKNLTILEKLKELNKKGIITNKEFQEKKKEILKRI
ncbi:MAG: SHOCT domain-containing protein [Candidatus Nitrosomaritimum yanchengensis]